MEWCPRCPGSADRLVCPGGRYCRFLDPEDPAHDPRYREVLERRLRGFPMPSQGIQAVIPWGSESVVIRETVGKVEDTFQAVPGSENVTIPVTVPSVPPYPGGEQIRLSVAAARALGARIDHVDKVPFVDRRGRERVALIPHYRRGEVVEDALHDARLGFYKSVPDLILSQVLVDQLHGIATISLEGAQRVIKGRLLKDHSSYRVVTALNLLDDYLAEDGSVASAFRRGYPDSNQLYLLLEYQRSAPNRVLPALVIQLVGSRPRKIGSPLTWKG
jgi:hypothetical protein